MAGSSRSPPPAFTRCETSTPRTIEPSRARAAETLTLERTLSDLVNQAYALTPAEIALMWQTAPPRMPIPPPGGGKADERRSDLDQRTVRRSP